MNNKFDDESLYFIHGNAFLSSAYFSTTNGSSPRNDDNKAFGGVDITSMQTGPQAILHKKTPFSFNHSFTHGTKYNTHSFIDTPN